MRKYIFIIMALLLSGCHAEKIEPKSINGEYNQFVYVYVSRDDENGKIVYGFYYNELHDFSISPDENGKTMLNIDIPISETDILPMKFEIIADDFRRSADITSLYEDTNGLFGGAQSATIKNVFLINVVPTDNDVYKIEGYDDFIIFGDKYYCGLVEIGDGVYWGCKYLYLFMEGVIVGPDLNVYTIKITTGV